MADNDVITSTFIFSNEMDSKKRFGAEYNGNEVYSKGSQPSEDIFKRRIAKLYNTTAVVINKTEVIIENLVMALASGNETIALNQNLPSPICNVIVKYANLHAIKYVLFNSVETFCNAITQNVKAVFTATASAECCGLPIKKLSEVCAKYQIPLITDNSYCTAYKYDPFSDGSNIIIDSFPFFSVGTNKNNYIALLESPYNTFSFSENNRYIRMFPFSKYNFELTAYFISKFKRIPSADIHSKECKSDFYMMLQGMRNITNRMQVYSDNSREILNEISKYSHTISTEIFNSFNSAFITAEIQESFTEKLKLKTQDITISKKDQLYSMLNCTAIFFENNKLYIRVGTEPSDYIVQKFKLTW